MDIVIYKVTDLSKCYAGREVLHVPELEIRRGEIFAIIGPNGSGKSTFLRLLNLLERPTSGSIIFAEHSAKDNSNYLSLQRRITMVFQQPLLFSTSVWENVAYGLRVRGQKDVKRQVAVALEQVGLLPFAKANVSTLSGGETQRVALARALVIEPEVLLLDEPTANLDPYNVALVENLVAEINRERATTVILVTHNVFQARRLGHRIMFLLEGQTVESGPAAQFFATPQDPRTAAFVRGEMVC